MSVLHEYAATLTQAPLPLGVGDVPSPATRFDEVIGPEGALRPAWKPLASATMNLTGPELGRVDAEIVRALADDGVTYAHRGGARPWRLDPLPLVMDAPTWARLEIGLAQRAELLNAIMSDVYGEQRLLAEGVVPAAAVFAHPGFVRAVARPGVVDRHPLLMSATDLGRDGDGEWRVLADRVQAPSGLGYAMENRLVISRMLPDLHHEADLHGLDPFFAVLRDALLQCAPRDDEDPRVVVLSPGTHSETAYDQAFLANTLGFPLVQGSDLVVSEGSVWIKPARWPRATPTDRVDVILRRVDSAWCDPLELRGDSQLGVAGLVEAVRRGRVHVVNGLGAGVLENPALLPFLGAACERLLGEQLRLPATPAWWCGDREGRAEVLARLRTDPDAVIVRTLDGQSAGVDADADELAVRIQAHPYRYVGLARLPLSQAPVWGAAGAAEAQPLVLRAFSVRYGPAYRTLAGGLATARDDEGAPLTKDVWVLKSDPAEPDQGLAVATPLTMIPSIPAMAPRALADMYWAGRYAERSEDLLRLALATQPHLERVRARGGGPAPVLLRVLQMLAGRRHPDPTDELRSLLVDADRPGSAAHALAGMRDALEGVRDQLSGDTWRVFSIADRAMASARESTHSPQVAESAGRMLSGILSLHGVTANMIRDTGWHMIEAGRYVERSLQLCTLLSATTVTSDAAATDRAVLDGVLLAAESLVTHRRRYRGYGRTRSVFDLLLNDLDNPRSLAFSLDRLRAHLSALPDSTGSTRPERLRDELSAALATADVAALAREVDGQRPALAAFLEETAQSLRQLSDAIATLHFAGGPPALEMSSLSLIEEMVRE
ncbi:circularly permuted type 2 ATP-grasp protein [Microbacterium hominis]|uniref:Circularly permuted type 2 ATP-grasp protein n=1 Tax=Microbacterium hominis TaxID=162426 RepID=A0A7D4Q0D1_9MICO|nr:circularly permuted type 2 ATP-grasp protein [Microbacterium hominis]QKJ18091.1 circularly permuted type 2 ATP-grasp protein [Microbacterium hominis]